MTPITPDFEGFAASAARGRLPAVRRRIPADLETPVSVYLKLRSAPDSPFAGGPALLLESVEQGIRVGRYSFIGVRPRASITLRGTTVTVERAGGVHEAALDPTDPLAPVREAVGALGARLEADVPGPFGGAVGYVGYEVARWFERLPDPSTSGPDHPDYRFVIPGTLVVFDHVKRELEVAALPPEDVRDPRRAYDAAAAEVEAVLAALGAPLPPIGGAARGPSRAEPPPPRSNVRRETFEAAVRGVQEHILAGDAFQVVLSQRFETTADTPPFQVYRALRILNPSPYMFFFDFGDMQMVGSSPEALVRTDGRRATLAPIAGTRPRSDDPAEDERLEAELLADEKERAEHVMLVDLGRNDLGRVCQAGSVRTDSFMQVERYSHVMHIVSRVSGTLRPGLDGFDLLRAVFPAGTVTGAPKIRAMELVRRFEPDRRGPYAGAVGYFGPGGDVDMCIAIRTITVSNGRYAVQAGAGIVADSDPAREYRETLDKVRALVRAVEIAERGF